MIDYPCFRQPIISKYLLIHNELRGFAPCESDRLTGFENKKLFHRSAHNGLLAFQLSLTDLPIKP